ERKGDSEDVFARAKAEGCAPARVDSEMYDLSQDIRLNKKVKHTIEVVVDRLVMPERSATHHRPPINEKGAKSSVVGRRSSTAGKAQEGEQSEWDAFVTRLTDSIEQALRVGEGMIVVSIQPNAVGGQQPAVAAQGSDGEETQAPIPHPTSPEEWLMS